MFTSCDPPSVHVRRAEGSSPYVLVCEHAGNRIPQGMGNLGLEGHDLTRHIAWDIGAAAVAERISEQLDATLISQPYSRLVIDCNRRTDDPELIPEESDGTLIPGNRGLSPSEKKRREDTIHVPFHDCITAELDCKERAGKLKALLTIHSFTPEIMGVKRPWHVGVIYNQGGHLAQSLLDLLGLEEGLTVGDNKPFRMTGENVHTIPFHGEGRGIAAVEIEIRQDLIADPSGQLQWASLLGKVLGQALEGLSLNAVEGPF